MLTLFLFYCLLGACGLAVYGSSDKSESAVKDWTYTVILILAWPLIFIAFLYKVFFGRP